MNNHNTFIALEELFNNIPFPVLTIGNFDGVHLGHQLIFNRLKERAQQLGGKSVVLTFSNHPSQILYSSTPAKLLCTLNHKISLFKQHGIDITILPPFTRELSQQTPEEFLLGIRKHLLFTHLILGSDAVFGKNRKGTPSVIRKLATSMNFCVEYLEKQYCNDIPISSSRVRQAIIKGDLVECSKLLGRPYSILSSVVPGAKKGRIIGFPTLNVNVEGLCLPPQGVYAVSLHFDGLKFKGVANLGTAPTLNTNRHTVLEVHVFDQAHVFNCKEVEVVFQAFLRPERKFPSMEQLREQIAIDINKAKNLPL